MNIVDIWTTCEEKTKTFEFDFILNNESFYFGILKLKEIFSWWILNENVPET